jgi:hypothetical protein
MVHYNNNTNESIEYYNKLYELLVNILLQEETNDNSILESQHDRPNDRTTEKSD